MVAAEEGIEAVEAVAMAAAMNLLAVVVEEAATIIVAVAEAEGNNRHHPLVVDSVLLLVIVVVVMVVVTIVVDLLLLPLVNSLMHSHLQGRTQREATAAVTTVQHQAEATVGQAVAGSRHQAITITILISLLLLSLLDFILLI